MTSLNMPGISLSLLSLTNVASERPYVTTSKLLESLDAPHNSPGWPASGYTLPLPEKLKMRKRDDKFVEVEKEEKKIVPGGPKLLGEHA